MPKQKKFAVVLFVLFAYLAQIPVGLCAEQSEQTLSPFDLYIPPETISERAFAGIAVTDRVEVEIMTDEGFENAKRIAEQTEAERNATQAELFSGESKTNVDKVAVKTNELDLFDSGYTASSTINNTENETSNDVFFTIVFLLSGLFFGIALAVILKNRKARGTT